MVLDRLKFCVKNNKVLPIRQELRKIIKARNEVFLFKSHITILQKVAE